jgi:hypothetical protein
MRRTTIGLIIGCACLALSGTSKAESAGSPSQAGMQININPQTGELLNQPAQQPVKHSARPSVEAPLQVVDGPTAAHGQMIDLKGRLHHQMNLQVGPDGKPVASDCEQKPQ